MRPSVAARTCLPKSYEALNFFQILPRLFGINSGLLRFSECGVGLVLQSSLLLFELTGFLQDCRRHRRFYRSELRFCPRAPFRSIPVTCCTFAEYILGTSIELVTQCLADVAHGGVGWNRLQPFILGDSIHGVADSLLDLGLNQFGAWELRMCFDTWSNWGLR